MIVAQTACELVAESAFDTFLRAREIADPPSRLRACYRITTWGITACWPSTFALTKDKIRSEAFWKDFTEHVTRRNGIVHKGRQVTEQEAEASLRAATALVTHVETVITDATTT